LWTGECDFADVYGQPLTRLVSGLIVLGVLPTDFLTGTSGVVRLYMTKTALRKAGLVQSDYEFFAETEEIYGHDAGVQESVRTVRELCVSMLHHEPSLDLLLTIVHTGVLSLDLLSELAVVLISQLEPFEIVCSVASEVDPRPWPCLLCEPIGWVAQVLELGAAHSRRDEFGVAMLRAGLMFSGRVLQVMQALLEAFDQTGIDYESDELFSAIARLARVISPGQVLASDGLPELMYQQLVALSELENEDVNRTDEYEFWQGRTALWQACADLVRSSREPGQARWMAAALLALPLLEEHHYEQLREFVD
jgi:hypothetical protein